MNVKSVGASPSLLNNRHAHESKHSLGVWTALTVLLAGLVRPIKPADQTVNWVGPSQHNHRLMKMDDKGFLISCPTDVLVLLSGGIDSSACASFYKTMGFHVQGLFIDFAQPSAQLEYEAALRISERLGMQLKRIVLAGMPKLIGKIRGRNSALLILALMFFPSKSGIIATGIHAGTPYEDCSEIFTESMQNVFDLYCNGCVKIGAPFLTWSKADIWHYAKGAGVPLNLTYSCEAGAVEPCGRCPSCKDIEALNDC